MGYDARGYYIPDVALKDRVTYLTNNPVWYSATVLNSIDENRVIKGDERLRFD